MRVLVCGSRTWADRYAISTVLGGLLRDVEIDVDEHLTVIQGLAKGADHLARHFYGGVCPICSATFASHDRVSHRDFPADWDRYGKRAGYVRNAQMLTEGRPDMVVAFRAAGASPGTDMMVDLARRHGVRTYVVGGSGL